MHLHVRGSRGHSSHCAAASRKPSRLLHLPLVATAPGPHPLSDLCKLHVPRSFPAGQSASRTALRTGPQSKAGWMRTEVRLPQVFLPRFGAVRPPLLWAETPWRAPRPGPSIYLQVGGGTPGRLRPSRGPAGLGPGPASLPLSSDLCNGKSPSSPLCRDC